MERLPIFSGRRKERQRENCIGTCPAAGRNRHHPVQCMHARRSQHGSGAKEIPQDVTTIWLSLPQEGVLIHVTAT
jgi:hypothetical protein